MKILEGNLVTMADNGMFDVIIHGCNCFCTMGAGIAKTIKQRWPQCYEVDKSTEKGLKDKLGSVSVAAVVTKANTPLSIVNAYTQFHWRGKGNKVDYEAIATCFDYVSRNFADKSIGYPLIGAGLAGGDWNIISKIIDDKLSGLDHTLVKYVPN